MTIDQAIEIQACPYLVKATVHGHAEREGMTYRIITKR